jgi:hypothetical protein
VVEEGREEISGQRIRFQAGHRCIFVKKIFTTKKIETRMSNLEGLLSGFQTCNLVWLKLKNQKPKR